MTPFWVKTFAWSCVVLTRMLDGLKNAVVVVELVDPPYELPDRVPAVFSLLV